MIIKAHQELYVTYSPPIKEGIKTVEEAVSACLLNFKERAEKDGLSGATYLITLEEEDTNVKTTVKLNVTKSKTVWNSIGSEEEVLKDLNTKGE